MMIKTMAMDYELSCGLRAVIIIVKTVRTLKLGILTVGFLSMKQLNKKFLMNYRKITYLESRLVEEILSIH